MTPHEALESIYRIEDRLGSNLSDVFENSGWEFTKLALELQPVHFHFGNIMPENAHVDFANQLFDNHIFRLPFPYIFITNDISPSSALLGYQDIEAMGDADFLNVVTLGPFRVGSQGYDQIIKSDDINQDGGYGEPASPLLMTFYENKEEIRWLSLTKKGMQYNSRGDRFENEESLARVSRNSFHLMIGYTALLMSKEVNQQVFPAPERLNKRRLKKKKPPISERRVITIRSNYIGGGDVGDLISGRKSPIMHWRRGHIRRLKDRTIPIPPMIINARDDSVPEPKVYKFKPG
jgi:hypothetical protein